jgi:hypothetical protein
MPEWTVDLPPHARAPFQVYVNGVPQREGEDFSVRGRTLVFTKPLAKDEVSKSRWFLGAWGVGTYRKDDSVDVAWEASDGAPRVAHRLDITPPTDG